MPWNQKVFYLFPTPENFFHETTILFYGSAGIILIALFAFIILKKQDKLLTALCLCWMIVVIPLLQFDVNNHSYVNERYLYILLIFPASIAVVWLQRFNLSEQNLKNVFICLTILFTILTFKRSLDWRNTHNLFTKDLQSDADSPYALSNLGVYYNHKGDYQKGREVLLRAIKVDPQESMFYNNYGWSLSELNERDSAIIYFKKAIALNDRNISALNNLGVCYAHKMMKDSAGIFFNRSYQLNPNHPETNFYMGTYYKFLGDQQQAGVYFARARELGNKDAIGK
jgi:tetratricopeptide (TPR) repeat protein